MFFNKIKKEDLIKGRIFPIVKCLKFNNNLGEEYIKKQILNRMTPEIMNYIIWEREEDENGVVLLKGRLDVLKRE